MKIEEPNEFDPKISNKSFDDEKENHYAQDQKVINESKDE